MGTLSKRSNDSLSGGLSRRLILPAAVLLIVGCVSISLLVSKQLRQVFDESLLSQLQSIAANVERDEGALELELAPDLMRNYERSDSSDYFQLWDGAGKPLFQSPSLSGTTLPVAISASSEPTFDTIRLPNGLPGRVASVQFHPRSDAPDNESVTNQGNPSNQGLARTESVESEPVLLAVATSNQPYLDLVSHIRSILGLVFLALMLALVWVIRRSLRFGLEPLTDIREKIMALDSKDLDQRIEPKRSVAELQGIVDQTNALLGRMEDSFARERQFSHDVAHELRTPLAELRNLAEVGSRWPGDEAMVKRFFDDAIKSASQMELTLTSLLTLARTNGNQEIVDNEKFHLGALVNEVRQRVCACTGTDPTNISVRIPTDYQLYSARHQWILIVQNLLNNAVSHGIKDTTISVSLVQDGNADGDTLCFENKTNELENKDLDKLFDRLWRKERARSQQEHAGLGLSLVKAYAEHMGLAVRASLTDAGVFQIAISGFYAASTAKTDSPSLPVNEKASLHVRTGLA